MNTPPLAGTHYLWRGYRWLLHPELRLYVCVPLIINMLLFAGLIYLAVHELAYWIKELDGFLPHWLHWLNSVLWIFFAGIILVALSYTFNWLANFIATPFNGLLAERVEALWRGETHTVVNPWRKMFAELGFALKQQLRLLAYFLPRALLFFIFLWIPLLQGLVSVLWFLFSGWMHALQYVSYPMENHQLPLKATRQALAGQKTLALSFGLSVAVMSLLPLINLFVMPAAVIGGTLLWLEKLAPPRQSACGSV